VKVVAIIPARGGSKRLKRKNIYPIWGKPMLYWSILACKQSNYDIDVWVSTEDTEIANIAKQYGAKVVTRDDSLADDKTFKQAVIRDAASKINNLEGKKDIYISLQANSPNIHSENIDDAIDVLLKHNRKEIISVDENLMQNAAFRVFRGDYVFQEDLSTCCGVFVCPLEDVHTLDDVKQIEKKRRRA
jgi:CMP-N,N'-diacetyllegionaminic acid synthase